MRTETKLHRTLLAGLAVIALTSCGGGGGDGDGGSSCSPPPYVVTVPPTVATVGQRYEYRAIGPHPGCFITCGSAELYEVGGMQLPFGAEISEVNHAVFWTPAANQANTDVQFKIAIEPTRCGQSVTQTWTVHAYAAPVIESFATSKDAVNPGESVVLTAVFQGIGQIEGIGAVTSGVPLTTPALTSNRSFRLIVTNGAGAQATQTLWIDVLGPPSIQSLTATPAVIGEGSSSTLRWTASGDYSEARLDPLGVDVRGVTSVVVTPGATTIYVLHLSNELGASASASVQVQVIPPSSIQSFTALPPSTTKGGSVLLSATFQGTGSIASELNGIYSTIASIASGGTLSTGVLLRTTGFRLSVANAIGAVTTRDMTVRVTGPGTFQPAAGQPLRPARFYHTATRLLDGRVFITGGNDVSTELFDPATETFSAGPNLLAQRLRHSAALLPDGRVLVVGGRPFPPQTAEIYNPATNTMSAAGQLPSVGQYSRSGPALELMDGRVVVQTTNGTQPGIVVFDPTISTFGPLIPFASPFAIASVAPLPNGRGLFSREQGSSEVFFPDTNTFSLSGAVSSTHRTGFHTLSLLDGRVLLVGGTEAPPEIYDPSTGAFAPLDQVFPRTYVRAVRLNDGKVLLVSDQWAELYDPNANSITTTGGFRTAREFGTYTATLLQDGRVLVVGGCGGLPCDAELYTP